MPARNIHLTDRYEEFVKAQVESGKFQNASEVMRTALMLLEKQEEEYELKMQALRDAVQEGIHDFDAGRYTTLENDDDIDVFFAKRRESRQ